MTSTPEQTSELAIHEPDEMGVWNEDGDLVWLPRSLYPKRIDAILWTMRQWGCSFGEVRCLSRWMRYEPHVARNGDGSIAWQEDRWWECPKDAPGAFRAWKLEG
jgi:hypothetical protein